MGRLFGCLGRRCRPGLLLPVHLLLHLIHLTLHLFGGLINGDDKTENELVEYVYHEQFKSQPQNIHAAKVYHRKICCC